MEYEKIEKVYEGTYLDYYNVTYRNEDGQEKVYEMVSRDKQIDSKEKLYDHSTDAVVMIVNDVSDEHVVLVKEFRLELGKTIFGFPAGLIDPGETAAECAVRELKEETGLDMVRVRDVLKGAFSAVGISNETTSCVIGTAAGNFSHHDTAGEEIDAAWYSKEEVRRLIKTEHFGSWAQAYCYMWSRED
ncbi:MAG: NUDIX hydrolase [Oscillospiraceae bacterium]|nr:NUDIX hydrolase [Oscillospiraceae bacterium]